MDWKELFSNKILWISVSGWCTAQVIKAILYAVMNRRFSVERLFGDGGMPSCHSATVCALATATGLELGFGSPVFALAMMFAIVVMHDAMGVRYQTGQQARAINDMLSELRFLTQKDITPQEKLQEFVGHTMLQVIIGAIIGFIVGVVGYSLW